MKPLFVAGALVVGSMAMDSHAYEEDVHYGLTYWLAMKAGFVHEHAETIATANVRYDHSRERATYVVVRYACLQRDAQKASTVRDNHFPSTGSVPGTPDERQVQANSDQAFKRVDDLLRDLPKQLTDEERQALLVAYGEGLHAAQDSWSHHGTPDPPPGGLLGELVCDPRLAYGHPVSRGGWREHIADLTSKHKPSEALAMAEMTYWRLCELRRLLDDQSCTTEFYFELSSVLGDLVGRNTKQGKADWFKTRGMQDTQFLDVINEATGKGYVSVSSIEGSTRIGKLEVPYSRLLAAAKGPLQFMQEFYTAFMTLKVPEVLKKLAIRTFAKGQLVPVGDENIGPEHREALIAFWQVRDHGEAVARFKTHNISSLPIGQVREILPWLRSAVAPYASVEEALLPLDENGAGVWADEVKVKDRLLWLGLARLRHAPSEILVVVAETIEGEPKVVGIDSFVDR